MEPRRPLHRESAMKIRSILLAFVLVATGCKNAEHSAGVTVVVQFKDPYHVTAKQPEIRLEYKVKGQMPDAECDAGKR